MLALYNFKQPIKVAVDRSSYRLGDALLQYEGDEWKPAAYAFRTLSDTEKRYAQVEKEALASTWVCERGFSPGTEVHP